MVALHERHSESEIDLTPIDVERILKLCQRAERALFEPKSKGFPSRKWQASAASPNTAMRIPADAGAPSRACQDSWPIVTSGRT